MREKLIKCGDVIKKRTCDERRWAGRKPKMADKREGLIKRRGK